MLGRSWEPATATIVAKKFKEGGERSGVWEYVADISTSSGAPFRTTLKQPPLMSHVVWLAVGDIVRSSPMSNTETRSSTGQTRR
jgi:hypothetical protein